ncbi:MAG: hypothetical protein M3Y85_03920 [Bacteroidota bacterium]|nr:hypothetical protein [Bacteroidota bacterium]
MRKFSIPLLLILSALVLFFSCRKTDSYQSDIQKTQIKDERFFTVSASASPEVKAIAEAVKKQDDKFHFLSSVIKKAGYPIWDKARIINFNNRTISGRSSSDSSGGELVYIPFALDSQNRTNAVLAVRLNNPDTTYRMLYAANYRLFGYDTTNHNRWNARSVFVLFSLFDYSVFGHTKFLIKDDSLYQPKTDSTHVVITLHPATNASGRTSTMAPVTECASGTHCDVVLTLLPAARSASSVNCYDWEYCVTYYPDSGGGSGDTGDTGGGGWMGTGNGTGGYPTGGGSGGGDSGWWGGGPPPCSGNTVVRTTVTASVDCGAGWTPVIMPKAPPVISDPCVEARTAANKAADISQEQMFLDTKAQIQAADPTIEHAVGFGSRDAAGNLTTTTMVNGGSNYGSVPDIAGSFADIHNHPGNTEPSAGDLYSLINKNTPTNGYDTRFVITGGTVYAFVIYNPSKADTFAVNHPPVQTINPLTGQPYPPEFPTEVFRDYDNAQAYFEGVLNYSQPLADAMAMAFALEKHNTGVAIIKQQPDGSFKILRVKQTNPGAAYPEFEDISCN